MNPPETHLRNLAVLDSKYIKLVAFPIAVALLAELMSAVFGHHPVQIGILAETAPTIDTYRPTEAALRFRLLGLLILLAIGASAIIVRFESERKTLFAPDSAVDLLKGAGICIVIAVAIILLAVFEIIPSSFDVLGQDVFGRAGQLVGEYPTDVRHIMSLMTLRCFMNVGGLFVGGAVACLIMSAISSLAQIPTDDLEAQKAHWKLQSERLQLTIYISTGLLVIGLLFIQSWAQWPTFAFLPGDKSPNPNSLEYSGMVNSYLAFTGIEYSLLLASFAIPVTVLLNAQASVIAEHSLINKIQAKSSIKPKSDKRKQKPLSAATIMAERKSENLVVQFIDQLKTIAAILAPFVAGSLGNFVTLISTKS